MQCLTTKASWRKENNCFRVNFLNSRLFMNKVTMKGINFVRKKNNKNGTAHFLSSLQPTFSEGILHFDTIQVKIPFGKADTEYKYAADRKRYVDQDGFVSIVQTNNSSLFYLPFKTPEDLVNEVNAQTNNRFFLSYEKLQFYIHFNPCSTDKQIFYSTPFSRFLGFSPLNLRITALRCPYVLNSNYGENVETIQLKKSFNLQDAFDECSGVYINETLKLEIQSEQAVSLTLNGYYDLQSLQNILLPHNINVTYNNAVILSYVMPFKIVRLSGTTTFFQSGTFFDNKHTLNIPLSSKSLSSTFTIQDNKVYEKTKRQYAYNIGGNLNVDIKTDVQLSLTIISTSEGRVEWKYPNVVSLDGSIENAYNEPQRRYHTGKHILQMFSLFDRYVDLFH